ncbi:MAG: YraN family protein [Clostridia bacterium]|nr:YraN family protein [Clostridia bacterium]
MKKSELGLRGETLAAEYLKEKGYDIIERNYRSGHLETDIVCENDERLVFVEVKTRTPASARFARPSAAVDAKKAARLIACAEAYMREKGLAGKMQKRVRIDVIEVFIDGADVKINVIENAVMKKESVD